MSKKHWTESNTEDFQFSIAFNFVEQIMDTLRARDINQSEFADTLGLSKGRVSQIINNPGNLTLQSIVRWSRALGQKVGVVLFLKLARWVQHYLKWI